MFWCHCSNTLFIFHITARFSSYICDCFSSLQSLMLQWDDCHYQTEYRLIQRKVILHMFQAIKGLWVFVCVSLNVCGTSLELVLFMFYCNLIAAGGNRCLEPLPLRKGRQWDPRTPLHRRPQKKDCFRLVRNGSLCWARKHCKWCKQE